jgi:DNA primase
MDFAAHVKSSVDIVSVVGESVRLRKQGSVRFVGLCPFHTEKTPSFSVHHGLQIFKCFGCGKGGDVFNFVMETQGLTFYEALRSLAERHGIPMPASDGGSFNDADSRLRESLDRMHENAQAWFREQIKSAAGTCAQEYIRDRGLSPDAEERFGLGYAPARGLVAGFTRQGFRPEAMEASGLVAKQTEGDGFYDRFRDRLTFPLHNERGKIIAFAGRALREGQQPKYYNSPETVIYKKQNVLYNLHRAREAMRQERVAVLVEGYMDVIGADEAGVRNVVASCGTALTEQHARTLRRHVDAVVVNFDPDTAGQEAVHRSIEVLIREGLWVRVLRLPNGLDPFDYCKQEGGDSYRGKLAEAPSYFDWLADHTRKRFDTKSAEGQSAAIEFVEPKIRWMPKGFERALRAEDVGHRMGLDRLLLSKFVQLFAESSNRSKTIVHETRLSESERILLRLMVESPEARGELLSDVVKLTTKRELPSHKLFEAIESVEKQDGQFQYAALEGRLEGADRLLFDKLLLAGEGPDPSMETGRSAVDALQREVYKSEYQAVLNEIASAERSGDNEKLLDLLRRKKEMAAPIVDRGHRGRAPNAGAL